MALEQERIDHLQTQLHAIHIQLQALPIQLQALQEEMLRLIAGGQRAVPPEQARVGALLTSSSASGSSSYSQIPAGDVRISAVSSSVTIAVPPAPSTDEHQTSDPPPFHQPETEDRQERPASIPDLGQIPAQTTDVSRRDEVSALCMVILTPRGLQHPIEDEETGEFCNDV